MKRFRFTLIGLFLAFLVFIWVHSFKIELFELTVNMLAAFEYQIDEVIIPLLIFLVFAFADHRRRTTKAQQLEFEKNKIYNAMLHASHHILNNFLNQMQLYRMKAEITPGIDPEIINLYDEITS